MLRSMNVRNFIYSCEFSSVYIIFISLYPYLNFKKFPIYICLLNSIHLLTKIIIMSTAIILLLFIIQTFEFGSCTLWFGMFFELSNSQLLDIHEKTSFWFRLLLVNFNIIIRKDNNPSPVLRWKSLITSFDI